MMVASKQKPTAALTNAGGQPDSNASPSKGEYVMVSIARETAGLCNEIEAVANITLIAMKHPDAYRDPDLLANVFSMISARVSAHREYVFVESHEVGWSMDVDDDVARHEAHIAFRRGEMH